MKEPTKTKYKYIYFKKSDILDYWEIRNNKSGGVIGLVTYDKEFSGWNQWVFEGFDNCIFSVSCLVDIIDFIKQLN